MKARVNGFQWPYSREQKFTWVAQPLAAASFYVIACLFLEGERRTWVVSTYSALFAILLVTWFVCEKLDPSKEGGVFCLTMKEEQKVSRYCAACRKKVPGLDHHCSWLNTCIGKRTYFPFYFLALSGAAASILHSATFAFFSLAGSMRQRQLKSSDRSSHTKLPSPSLFLSP